MVVEIAEEATVAIESDEALPVTRSRLLHEIPGVVHGITRRVPGLGRADGNLGFGAPRDKADAWAMRQRWCAAIGVDPERLVAAGQVHGTTVLAVSADQAGLGARPDAGRLGIADALMTDAPGVPLLSLHADCLPLLLVDPERPAVAAVHAGWRGTVADVAGKTVRAMAAAYGSRPERLRAFLGPAIEGCCYQVGPEVAAAWEEQGDAAAKTALCPEGDRWRFDLHRANALLLARAGVRPDHMERSSVCTLCATEAWFSHRGQGATTGRFGAIIALRG